MSETDCWKIFPRLPRKISINDITTRDGFQHEERFISTDAKIFYIEELIFAGCQNIEVTNLGNPFILPQFADGEKVLTHLRSERFIERCAKKGIKYDDLCLTAVTIRESAVDRAIELKKSGLGPDRILMLTSTEEQHHFTETGTTLPEYWKEAERCIKKAGDVGIKVCGAVSTIWGGPISGATDINDALEFTIRWLEIGASDIEHADHDGSASAPDVYAYFTRVLDKIPNPDLHIAHFHETKRVASASVLAALQAGIVQFEATLGGIGGQPATFMDDRPIKGVGEYYYKDPNYVGLVSLEDTLVQIDEMGIEHSYDIDRVLWLGRQMEKTLGRRLRSDAIINGRTQKNGHEAFERPELPRRKKQRQETAHQRYPSEWSDIPVLPERCRVAKIEA